MKTLYSGGKANAIAFLPGKHESDREFTLFQLISMINPKSVPDLLRAPIPDAPAGKQPIRLLVCGIPKGVDNIIHRLHSAGFAEVREWSPPLPSPVAGEVIRILTRYYA